jgi:glycosyltransferase involved in cell wall biosynthesis
VKNVKVSVIIPTHNRAKLLERAIKSVLEQTYANFEIIVVSDGSTDETDLIMQKYKNQDARIKYISYYPAKGANHARNIGIKAAEGEYIAFLDDDDEKIMQLGLR